MAAELPEDGEAQLGAVWLPRGRRIIPDGHGPVAWVTSSDVRDPGRVWAALTDLHPHTGLIPVLLAVDERDADPEDYYFYDPVDPRDIDTTDAARELAARWWDPDYEEEPFVPPPTPRSDAFLGLRGRGEGPNSMTDIFSAIFGMVTDDRRREEFEQLNQLDLEEAGWPPSAFERASTVAERPPKPGRPFPGLAPAVRERLTTAERAAALAGLPPARICLVPAGRPADVLAVTGWITTDAYQEPSFGVQVGAVLRSWEDRFGARLLKLGPGADAWLLVDRPPRTREAAEPVAAEHWAFADEFNGEGQFNFTSLADAIVGRPIWQFWWD